MMRKRLLATAVFAALPLAAGFAFSGVAHAQDMYQAVQPSMPQAGADYTRISQLEQQVRELTGQLEQRDFQIRQLESAFTKFSNDTNTRLQDLESKLSGTITGNEPNANSGFETPAAPSSPSPSSLQPSGGALPNPAPLENGTAPTGQMPTGQMPTGQMPTGQMPTGQMDDPNGAYRPLAPVSSLGEIDEGKPAGAQTGEGAPLTSGKPQTTSAAQAYDQAFSYLQQNKYVDAQRAFSDFLKNYASHPLAANAQFWLGETYFAQSQYQSAAKVFAKAFQEHPKGQKAPDALFKLALTLEKMNKKEDACLTLQELSKRFTTGPSSVLRRASEEGKRMGCKS